MSKRDSINNTAIKPKMNGVIYSKMIGELYVTLWLHYSYLGNHADSPNYRSVLSKLISSTRKATLVILSDVKTFQAEPNNMLNDDIPRLRQRLVLTEPLTMKNLYCRDELGVIKHIEHLEKYLVRKLNILSLSFKESDISYYRKLTTIKSLSEQRLSILKKVASSRFKRFEDFDSCHSVIGTVEYV